MNDMHMKEEVLKQFDEKFSGFDLSEVKLSREQERSCIVGSPKRIKSFLSSVFDKAYAAGKQDGIREEGTKTQNSSGRYMLGYSDGKKDGRDFIEILCEDLEAVYALATGTDQKNIMSVLKTIDEYLVRTKTDTQ